MSKKIIANEKIDPEKLTRAREILRALQMGIPTFTANGHGPFLAAIHDNTGACIAKAANSVILDNCSNNHAEINALKAVQKTLQTFDLSAHDLSIYITSEPCVMCIGALMWSGIKHIYYGVPSKQVEKITGFDEGFKPRWLREFKKRGITVYGNIEADCGAKALSDYITAGNSVYKPKRG